jgi:hypothetical protein
MAFSFFNSENLPTVHVKHFKPNQFGKTEETEDFSGESS